jgi:hypothetical protein
MIIKAYRFETLRLSERSWDTIIEYEYRHIRIAECTNIKSVIINELVNVIIS